MFKAPLNWACQKYEGGRPLLSRHVLEKFRIPTEKDPKRPVLDEPTIRALLSVAEESIRSSARSSSWRGKRDGD
jgi:hypothetical protein